MPDTSRHPAASAGVTSTASHLSIGEVLGLLLEEFPDVTISKIRFLESQGLIEPERTPSGYRKFFEGDVELLRLILREQRENFLPLRVIKDRIDSGEILKGSELPDTAGGVHNVMSSPDQLPGFERAPPDDPPLPGASGDDPTAEPDEDAGDPDPDDPRPDESAPDEPGADDPDISGAPSFAVGAAGPIDDTTVGLDTTPPDGPGPDEPGPSDGDESGDAESVGDEPRGTDEPDDPEVNIVQPDTQRDEPVSQTSPDRTGDLVTASELAAMVSTTPNDIADLQSYGLIAPRENMGEPLFDDDAVAVARICARLLSAGVDVRHLRGWKTSADRETSVYEQLTVPLLRQRNPHGRQVARERLVELRELGTSLRQALIDAELRHYLEH
ncbi:MAG: MerR family transcriptional regulator [Acidimicrobiia bacterium]|jgi:DNA-binding transcriptional MerR regulator|nr:MerR family transcriptional regulator [Acidimicrobiia bacterium]